MSKYNTVQRGELLDFLGRNRDRALTVHEIAVMMESDPAIPKAPGESTVYRLIKELVESGEVRRTVKGNSRKFLYQITDGEACRGHLHLKCDSCGQVYHMHDQTTAEMIEKILEKESFELDKSIVLSGKCERCRKSS
ncbi:MAG: transcriptional repressor [Ruminococcus sp.]|nr:transcriptional repressor [Ruminococcus sp.]